MDADEDSGDDGDYDDKERDDDDYDKDDDDYKDGNEAVLMMIL